MDPWQSREENRGRPPAYKPSVISSLVVRTLSLNFKKKSLNEVPKDLSLGLIEYVLVRNKSRL